MPGIPNNPASKHSHSGTHSVSRFSGQVRAEEKDPRGNIISDTGWVSNIETNYLGNSVAAWLAGRNNTGYNPLSPPTMIELGTGTGTPAVTDTALFTPAASTLIQCSLVNVSAASTTQFIAQYFGTTNNAGTYTEAGIFDTAGNLWAHTLISISISNGNTTTVTWLLTQQL